MLFRSEAEFADSVVTRADLVALRRKVVATVDPAIAEAAVDVTAVLVDGRREHIHVAHAIGSLQRPMSDADLNAKFHALADPVLGQPRSAALIAALWGTGGAVDMRQVVALAAG